MSDNPFEGAVIEHAPPNRAPEPYRGKARYSHAYRWPGEDQRKHDDLDLIYGKRKRRRRVHRSDFMDQ